MAGDDYAFHNYFRVYGFWGTQRVIYSQWTGRYTSTFLGSLLTRFGWPNHYYFLHTVLLFLFLAGAIFFLLSTINRCWLAGVVSRPVLALVTVILVVLSVYVQAEPATGFYWFSSAMTYETAFILFLLFAACLIRRYSGPGQGRIRLFDGMIFLLILLINGTNEVAAVFLTAFLGMLAIAAHYFLRAITKPLLVWLGLSFATGVVVVLTSGVLSGRSASMYSGSNTSVAAILPIIFFRVATVFYYVLKVPLFWIGGWILFIAGRKLGQERAAMVSEKPWILDAAQRLFTGGDGRMVVQGLVAIVAVVFFTLAGILMASKGSLPDRALNNLTELTLFFLLFLSFIGGAGQGAARPAGSVGQAGSAGQGEAGVSLSSAVIAVLLVAGLFASDSEIAAWKSVFSGYFYHSVAADRRQQLEKAAEEHQKAVVLEPFDKARLEKVRESFPHGVFVTVQEMLEERPVFLFRGIDLDRPDPRLRYYYNLDSVIIK